jgi:hypothetical protein
MHPTHIEFNGFKYRLSGNYYRRNVWGSQGPSNLHRAVWQFHKGPIPEGHEVHHKDEDTFNNVIENLDCVPMHEHQRAHMLERIARGELQPPSKEALEIAAMWHKSKDGRAWHVQNALKVWQNRQWYPVKCVVCSKEFEAPNPGRAKYCHPNCRQQALRDRRKASLT